MSACSEYCNKTSNTIFLRLRLFPIMCRVEKMFVSHHAHSHVQQSPRQLCDGRGRIWKCETDLNRRKIFSPSSTGLHHRNVITTLRLNARNVALQHSTPKSEVSVSGFRKKMAFGGDKITNCSLRAIRSELDGMKAGGERHNRRK